MPFRRTGKRQCCGFTLLEVLVALTITGMALGALFSVIAGNKRLAWNGEDVLLESTQVRSMLNYAQLNDHQGTVTVDLSNQDLRLDNEMELPPPERKTEPSRFALRRYEVHDAHGALLAGGTYWVELALPE